jgi:NAD(P)-dependent dehydrogenase (short-subunit alcohol dehydrogenase family)
MRPDETREPGEGEEEREPFSTGGAVPPEVPRQPERTDRPQRGLETLTPHDDFDDEDDEDDDDDFDDEDDEDEGVRTVLITGASGNIGRKLRAAWAGIYDFVLLDHEAGADQPDVILADLDVLDEKWLTHFHGVDTVIHLAANPNEFASWEELERPNIDALANVFHACALAGVERLIFASSNHAMGGYRELSDMAITVDLPPKPDGPYGATKLMGERLGGSLARAFDITFIALRLGWVQPGANRPDTLPDDWARAMWLSNRDLVRLFECAVEAELDDQLFVVVNGMSNNSGMRWDLSGAQELLGYSPEDDAYAEEL